MPGQSLQIWVFIRIISAKSTPAWQTAWISLSQDRQGWCDGLKAKGRLPPSWEGIIPPLPWVSLHEGWPSCRWHACNTSCFISPEAFEVLPRLPACLPVLLHGFAHYVTAENPVLPPACEPFYLWKPMHTAGAALQAAQIPHLQISTKRLKASPEAVSCTLARTRTHACTETHTHTRTHSSIPLTFSKPRTHSRTFLRISVSISQSSAARGGQTHPKGVKPKSGRFLCSSAGQLQHPETDCDWLRSGCCCCCRPSHSLYNQIPPLPFKQL